MIRLVLGFLVGYLIIHFIDFSGSRQIECKNKGDFDAKINGMIFDLAIIDAKGNKINTVELESLFKNNPRISGLKSPYATEKDFQIGCDALDDIVQRFSSK